MNGWTTIYLLNEYIAISYVVSENIRHWEKRAEQSTRASAT
jgi:hypothetical protein